MSLELLKFNIKREKELILQIETLYGNYESTNDVKTREEYKTAIESKIKQIKLLNNSIPELVLGISLIKKMPSEINSKNEVFNKNLVSLKHDAEGGEKIIGLNKNDKKAYLQELQISDIYLKRLRKKIIDKNEATNNFKKPNFYIVLSNRFFSGISNNLISKGYFKGLRLALKKSDFTMLVNSYVSVVFFTTLLGAIGAFFVTLFFMFFGLSIDYPFIFFLESGIIERLKFIWIFPVIPIITFLIIYFYPNAEKSSIEQNTDYELPFATIQMAAIASSDIEPSNIFRIMALSKEYEYIKRESKKLMNQINLYGYDLVTAIRNVSVASPSKNWADLLNGISTTIRSGGDLSKYLNKKAESLMFEYQLKREKAIKSAETFMDIYISVVIAAPMLMMMLLIMISISQIGLNIPIYVLAILVIAVVGMINVVFLVFLHLNQRKI
ncbi:MAG: type II secretion system F family protein [Nanoarchaeota archaeon]